MGIYLSGKPTAERNQAAVPSNPQEVRIRPVGETDHIRGNPNAEVVIVEYSDTECPFCKQFHTTLQTVMEKYGRDGRVAWVYRHFPLDQLHPTARKEAEALECAGELGGNEGFWAYTDELYSVTPSNNRLDMAELPRIASRVGLDVTQFNTCLDSGRHADKVERDYQDAVAAGGRGTPYSVILTRDGQRIPVSGAVPASALELQIDSLLR